MAHRLLREEDGHTDLHIFLKVNFENVVARLVRIIDNGQTERRREPNLLLVHPEELTRFGESIGINKSLCSCTVGLDTGRLSMRDPPQGPINDQYYQCVQSIYRGIESHTSITSLTLDLECMGIPVNESLPRFNFQDAPNEKTSFSLIAHRLSLIAGARYAVITIMTADRRFTC